MEHIVLGFDGSNPARVALDWVAERAARVPCRVEIVTVAHGDPLSTTSAAAIELERRVTDRAPDAEVSTRRLAGRMPDSLIRAAEFADVLVIGAHRRAAVRSVLTGWLPLRTASRSQVPVVVVPDDWAPNDGGIIVGVDDDDSSSAAVPLAAIEAEAAGVGLTLLHAWQMPLPTTEGAGVLLASSAHVKAAHQEVLDRASDLVAAAHPTMRLEKVLAHESPSSALVSRSARASLVVLGTHHRGVLESAVLGSVCQDVLWQSSSPVCVVPARSLSR